MTDRFVKGMSIRSSISRDAHVDKAEAAKKEFDNFFQTLITEGAWNGQAQLGSSHG